MNTKRGRRDIVWSEAIHIMSFLGDSLSFFFPSCSLKSCNLSGAAGEKLAEVLPESQLTNLK